MTSMGAAPYLRIILVLVTATCVRLETQNFRLSPIYKPQLYQIDLTVPQSAFSSTNHTYSGAVEITFGVIIHSAVIELHADQEFLEIQSVFLGNDDVAGHFEINNVTNIMTINRNVVIGVDYKLKIAFQGLLSTTDMNGFYKSTYTDSDGTTRYVATTQFEPMSARRAFPCFDEPAMKAQFEITIKFPKGMLALSNTLMNGTLAESTDDLQEIRFARTPQMSTYLVAFVISDFNCSEPGTMVDNIRHRICSRKETISSRSWAEEIGPKVLASLNNYTQINYSEDIGKLDLIAIPDFSAGAMENWGLVTYREKYLLWDPEESSSRYKQYVATIVAHELAHQWFGDLVTLQWWSELFLNEGFAEYFSYFAVKDILPEWELEKQFVIESFQTALDFDVLEGVNALQSNVTKEIEAVDKFDTISYNKGGSILRMIEHILGAANFRAGLQQYLKTYRFKNTVPENLWMKLGSNMNFTYSNLNVSETLDVVIDEWIKKSGFPLVKATLRGNTVTLSQTRFLLSGNGTRSEWYIPISYTTSADQNKFASTSPRAWLKPNANVTITLPTNRAWIILNNQLTGYYRVNYDDTLWNRIGIALRSENFGGIHEVNRAQIVDDLFNLARTGQVRYSEVFRSIEFLAKDTSYFSWTPAFSGFSFLFDRIAWGSVLEQRISSHLLTLMTDLYESTPIRSLNETDQIYSLKQVLAQTWACSLDHPNCTQQQYGLFSSYKINGTRPNKNLRGTVYCTALRHSSDSSDWDFLWNKYLNASLADEKSTIMISLGCTNNVTLLERYLAMTLNNASGIRPQDRYSVFISVLNRSKVGVNVTARFLRDNYQEIAEKYQSMNAVPNLLRSLASKLTTQAQINELRNFTEANNSNDALVTAVNSAIVVAESNLRWIQEYQDDLEVYFGVSDEKDGGEMNTSKTIILALLVAISLFRWY